MAGIYLHLPFCRTKCTYCDFYSGNQLYLLENYVEALKGELKCRCKYIDNQVVNSIYFGGGTPSLMTATQIGELLKCIDFYYNLSPNVEVTLECNPEDISAQYLNDISDAGINRISLGVQFLDNNSLSHFNRKHTDKDILNALSTLNASQISNLSVDLIYAVSTISTSKLAYSLKVLFDFDIFHLSAYSLGIGEYSRLYWQLKNNLYKECDEDIFLEQYHLVQNFMLEKNFHQYETSNYAKLGFESIHNLGYWNGNVYLGAGVSAHSYNSLSRQWNHKNIKKYIDVLSYSNSFDLFEIEYLDEVQRFNEYVIMGTRTFLGYSGDFIHSVFDRKIEDHFISTISVLVNDGYFRVVGNRYIIKEEFLIIGDFLANKLIL